MALTLNYTGDVTESVGQVMGPDLHGAFYAVEDADYSETMNWTRLFLKPILPTDTEVIVDDFGQIWVTDGEA